MNTDSQLALASEDLVQRQRQNSRRPSLVDSKNIRSSYVDLQLTTPKSVPVNVENQARGVCSGQLKRLCMSEQDNSHRKCQHQVLGCEGGQLRRGHLDVPWLDEKRHHSAEKIKNPWQHSEMSTGNYGQKARSADSSNGLLKTMSASTPYVHLELGAGGMRRTVSYEHPRHIVQPSQSARGSISETPTCSRVPPNNIVTAAFQRKQMESKDRQLLYDFGEMEDTSERDGVPTLQWLAKTTIVMKLGGMYNLGDAQMLEYPHEMKRYISCLSIPEDVDVRLPLSQRTFFFTHQHSNHKVYPATMRIDDTPVLIKVMHLSEGPCMRCRLGGKLLLEQHADDWMTDHLSNVQRCFGKQYKDVKQEVVYYILEHPLITLDELCFRLMERQQAIPEYLIWDFVEASLMTAYTLEESGMSNNLYEAQHFVCFPDGKIKLENLILYMSSDTCVKYVAKPLISNNIMEYSGFSTLKRLLSAVRALSLVYFKCVTLETPHFTLSANIRTKGEQYSDHTVKELQKNLLKNKFPQNTYSRELIAFISTCVSSSTCSDTSWFHASILRARKGAVVPQVHPGMPTMADIIHTALQPIETTD